VVRWQPPATATPAAAASSAGGLAAAAVLRGERLRARVLEPEADLAVSEADAAGHPALAQARIALQRTPDQLPVLRKAGVVDAGAQGFVDLLEGIGDFLARRGLGRAAGAAEDAIDPDFSDVHDALHAELDEIDPRHRWCTECLLVGEGLDRAGLQAAMSDLGADCVVVAGGAHRVKVHAHVARAGAAHVAHADRHAAGVVAQRAPAAGRVKGPQLQPLAPRARLHGRG
jgi:hypothetical protein